jgi:hypothetical protein
MMFRLLLLLGLAWMSGPVWAETQFRIFTLQHRFGQDLLPAIKPLVGEEGTASAIDNHLLIQAAPERMPFIEQAIARLDTELRSLRITVRHNRVTQESSRGAEVSGIVQHGDVRLRLPRRDGRVSEGVGVTVGQHETSISDRASEYLSVMEGKRAVIAVGKSVPFTENWLVLSQRHARIQQTIRYRDITTGFSVMAHLIGDEVELEIMPRIAQLLGDGVIEFQELATTVRVPRGQWIDLGGTMGAHDEVSRAILSLGATDKRQDVDLWIMVE